MGKPKSQDWSFSPIILYKNLDVEWMPLNNIFGIKPNAYLINKCGDVYSIKSKKILSHEINYAGYHRIQLRTINGFKHFSIHRLVASVYVVNQFPERYTDVNHRNGNKDCNEYWNLEWCTNNMNKHHASINGLYEHGEQRYNSVYPDLLIEDICTKFQNGELYEDVCLYYKDHPFADSYDKIRDLIYKIYHRKSRLGIVSKYKY